MILTYDFGPMNPTYDILTYEKKWQDFYPKLYVQPIRNLAAQARSGNGSTPGGKHVRVHQFFEKRKERI